MHVLSKILPAELYAIVYSSPVDCWSSIQSNHKMQLSTMLRAHTQPQQHLPDIKISVFKTIEFSFTVTYCSCTPLDYT